MLAFHYTQTKRSTPLADAKTQQGFIDERTSFADPSRLVDDDQDDEMSEPTQTTSAEERKVDETTKELRAPLSITSSSHASSSRLDDKTHEQLTRSTKQARTAKKGVEALQDVSYLFQKGHCGHQRNDFLQVRMASYAQKQQQESAEKKDGERNLHIPSCTLDVQAALRETRRIERNQWMKFNAGIILTDEEVRQLTEAGCEIYPDEMG